MAQHGVELIGALAEELVELGVVDGDGDFASDGFEQPHVALVEKIDFWMENLPIIDARLLAGNLRALKKSNENLIRHENVNLSALRHDNLKTNAS